MRFNEAYDRTEGSALSMSGSQQTLAPKVVRCPGGHYLMRALEQAQRGNIGSMHARDESCWHLMQQSCTQCAAVMCATATCGQTVWHTERGVCMPC